MNELGAKMKMGTEFWRYSSRNRAGHQMAPKTEITREIVLIHWAAGWTMDAISLRLAVDIDTVRNHLRAARRAKDPRAAIRHAGTLMAMEMAS